MSFLGKYDFKTLPLFLSSEIVSGLRDGTFTTFFEKGLFMDTDYRSKWFWQLPWYFGIAVGIVGGLVLSAILAFFCVLIAISQLIGVVPINPQGWLVTLKAMGTITVAPFLLMFVTGTIITVATVIVQQGQRLIWLIFKY
jgi:hypothetical protein